MFFERRQRVSVRSVVLFLGDVLCLAASFSLAAFLRLGMEDGWVYLQHNQYVLIVALLTYLLVFYIGGMYERQTMTHKQGVLLPSALLAMIGLVLIIVMFYARFELIIGRGVLVLAALFVFLSSAALRSLYRATAGYSMFCRNALVVGEGKDAANIIRLIQEEDAPGCRIFGVVTYSKKASGELLEGVPIIGTVVHLRDFVEHYKAETLVVATSLARENNLLKILRPLRYAGIELRDYASFFEQIAREIPVDHIDDEWLMHAAMNSSRIHIRKIKRIVDVSVSVLGLLLSLPISLITAVCIKMDSSGNVLYRQERAGLDGEPYTLLKFRTMQEDAETVTGAVWAHKNDNRVTRVGRFLRKSRIDEIPQLINVLRGEMSLVGPRPERPEFIEELAETIPFYRERLLVPPGITGWAQINYPYAASITAARRKLQYDLYYIKHMSLFMDIAILLRTFKTIIVGLRHSEDYEGIEEQAGAHEESKLTVLPGGVAEKGKSKMA